MQSRATPKLNMERATSTHLGEVHMYEDYIQIPCQIEVSPIMKPSPNVNSQIWWILAPFQRISSRKESMDQGENQILSIKVIKGDFS